MGMKELEKKQLVDGRDHKETNSTNWVMNILEKNTSFDEPPYEEHQAHEEKNSNLKNEKKEIHEEEDEEGEEEEEEETDFESDSGSMCIEMNHFPVDESFINLKLIPRETSKDRIQLNISGELYETRIKTLERFPHTLLGNRNKRLLHYCPLQNQYFFQRSRIFFDSILFFYQSNGILQRPYMIPLELFEEECRFFELPEDSINALRSKDDLSVLFKKEPEQVRIESKTLKSKIWDLLQNPETSPPAKYFAVFSLFLVAVSVATSCMETIPELIIDEAKFKDNPWAVIELLLNIWFLFELVLSAICSPSKKDFFLDSMTWFDMFAVFPYFIILSLSSSGGSAFAFLRILRIVRVGRLLRLSKHSKRIKIVVKVVKSSVPEFKAFMMCIAIVLVFGGSLMYYMERDQNEALVTDIPTGMYWAIQTITTIGYGDVHPKTVGGMFFAATYMTFGAMTLTIPVLTIITKFVSTYECVNFDR